MKESFVEKARKVMHRYDIEAEEAAAEEEAAKKEAWEKASEESKKAKEAKSENKDDKRPDVEDVGKEAKSENKDEERPNVEDINKESKEQSEEKSEEKKSEEKSEEKKSEEKSEEKKSEEKSEEKKSEAPEVSAPIGAWTINNTVLQVPIENGEYGFLGYCDVFILADELGIDHSLFVYRDVVAMPTPLGEPKFAARGDTYFSLEDYVSDLRKSQLPQIPDLQDKVEAYVKLGADVEVETHGQTTVVHGVPTNNGTKKVLSPITWALGERVLKKITPVPPAGSKKKGFDPELVTVTITNGIVTKVARDEEPNYLSDYIS